MECDAEYARASPLVPLQPCGSRRQSAAARAYSSAGAESRGLVLTARADLSEERKLPESDERHPADVDDAAKRSNPKAAALGTVVGKPRYAMIRSALPRPLAAQRLRSL